MKCHRTQIRDRLIRKAATSQCRFAVSAIGLDYRGRVIASKVNRPRFIRHGGGIHAEMAIMLDAPKSLKTIIIARINKKGKLLPIHPCKQCAEKATELGVAIRSIEKE